MPVLYLDEDVKFEVALTLRALQYDITTTRGEGRLQARDPAQLRFAAQHGRVLVTCNRRDFHALHEGWLDWSRAWSVGRDHAGVLAMDQGHLVSDYVNALIAFFAVELPLTNRMYDWSRNTNT